MRHYILFRVVEKFYVGELVDNEMPVFPQRRYVNISVFIFDCKSNLFILLLQ